jgi:hypothetical protein
MVPAATFETSVFINCPFDDDYVPLLQAMLFALVRCGLAPRIATERADSGEVRYRKIVELQKACRFSIHDLSRMDRGGKKQLARYNMPFELGLDFGLRESGIHPWHDKRCLVLDTDRYRYQRALSDLAGHDIKAHGDDPGRLVRHVRDWLVENGLASLPHGTLLWKDFNVFYAALDAELRAEGLKRADLTGMTVVEYLRNAAEYCASPPLS